MEWRFGLWASNQHCYGGVDELPLPAIGAALIWVPAAIYLTLFGAWFKASILVAIGILAIGFSGQLLATAAGWKGNEASRLPRFDFDHRRYFAHRAQWLCHRTIGCGTFFITAWGIFVHEQDV